MNKKTICVEIMVCMLIMLSIPALSEYGGSGSSGGSQEARGVVTCEASDNVLKVEQHNINMEKDITSSFSFAEPDLNMYEMSIDGRENENDIAVRVEYLKGKSVCVVKAAPGKIYQYINIWTDSKNVASAKLKFKVEDVSIGNNINLDVFQWDKKNQEWTKLENVIAVKMDKDMHFELNINSFGNFAIGIQGQGASDGLVNNDRVVTNSPIPTATGIDTVGKTASKDISDVPIPLRKNSSGIGIFVIIIMLLYMTYARIGR